MVAPLFPVLSRAVVPTLNPNSPIRRPGTDFGMTRETALSVVIIKGRFSKIGWPDRRMGIAGQVMGYQSMLTLAVTSISSFIFSSINSATNIVAAGLAVPRYFLRVGEQGSKSRLSGKI